MLCRVVKKTMDDDQIVGDQDFEFECAHG